MEAAEDASRRRNGDLAVIRSLLPMMALAASPALAQAPTDLTLTITAADQASWGLVGGFMDQCVSGAVLHGQTDACTTLSRFLESFAPKVKAATPIKRADAPLKE